MNILAQAKDLYDGCGIDMNKDIATYAANGYVFITPDNFLLGKAVNSKSDVHPQDQWNIGNPDAWYIHMAIGKISRLWQYLPHPLPLVGWMRQLKNQPVKFYKFNTISRRK